MDSCGRRNWDGRDQQLCTSEYSTFARALHRPVPKCDFPNLPEEEEKKMITGVVLINYQLIVDFRVLCVMCLIVLVNRLYMLYMKNKEMTFFASIFMTLHYCIYIIINPVPFWPHNIFIIVLYLMLLGQISLFKNLHFYMSRDFLAG